MAITVRGGSADPVVILDTAGNIIDSFSSSTITGPLGRQSDNVSISSALSTENVALLNSILIAVTSGVPSSSPGVAGTPISGSAWQIRHRPTTGTQATATQAAPGANQRLIVTSITFTAIATLVSTTLTSYVEVIATPSNTVLWDAVVGVKGTGVGDASIMAQPVTLVVPTNEAVTVRFGAGVTNLAEAVAANGYTVSV